MITTKPQSPLHFLGDTTVLKNVVKTGEDYRAMEEFRTCSRDFARDYLIHFLNKNYNIQVGVEDLEKYEQEIYGQL